MAMLITIVAAPEPGGCGITVDGFLDDDFVSDTEVASFGVTGEKLTNAVAGSFGATPSAAWLRYPTDSDREFQARNWTQTVRRLTVKGADVVGLASEPVVLASQAFPNQSSDTQPHRADLTAAVTQSVRSTWTGISALTVNHEIGYAVSFAGVGPASSPMAVSQVWGDGGPFETTHTFDSSSVVTMNVPPGKTYRAELRATRFTLDLRVVHEASLAGEVAYRFEVPPQRPFGPPETTRFFTSPTARVMEGGGLPYCRIANSLLVTHDIRVVFSSAPDMDVRDITDGGAGQ